MKANTKKILSWIWLLGCFTAISVFMWKHIDCVLGNDMASEMVLSKLLSEEGRLISPNWYYSTEVRVFNTHLVWTLLFMFLEDWHVVRVLGSIICYIAMLASYFYFCCQINLRKEFPVLAGILLLPISSVYFYIVLKGMQYIPYIIVSFLIFGMIVKGMKKENTRKTVLLGGGDIVNCRNEWIATITGVVYSHNADSVGAGFL